MELPNQTGITKSFCQKSLWLCHMSFPYFFGEWGNTFLFFVAREVLWFLLRLDRLACSTHCTTQPSSEHQVLVLYPCSHFCWNGREIGPKGSLATLLLMEILSLFFTLKSHRTDSGSNPCVNKTFFYWTGGIKVQGCCKDVFGDCVGRRV